MSIIEIESPACKLIEPALPLFAIELSSALFMLIVPVASRLIFPAPLTLEVTILAPGVKLISVPESNTVPPEALREPELVI